MNASGYEKYGRKMIDSWHRYWPHYMQLDVYCEGFELTEKNWAGINELDLLDLNPELVEFKARHADRPDQQNPQELAHGAVRFSHKSFAVIHACLNNPDTVVINLGDQSLDPDGETGIQEIRADNIENIVKAFKIANESCQARDSTNSDDEETCEGVEISGDGEEARRDSCESNTACKYVAR